MYQPSASSSSSGVSGSSSTIPIVYAEAVPVDDPFVVVPPAQATAVPINSEAAIATTFFTSPSRAARSVQPSSSSSSSSYDHSHHPRSAPPTATLVGTPASSTIASSDTSSPGIRSSQSIPQPQHSSFASPSSSTPYDLDYHHSSGITGSSGGDTMTNSTPIGVVSSHSVGGGRYSIPNPVHSSGMCDTASSSFSSLNPLASMPYDHHHHHLGSSSSSSSTTPVAMDLPLSMSDRSSQPVAPYVTGPAANPTTTQSRTTSTQLPDGTTSTSTRTYTNIRPGTRMTPYV